MGLSAPSFFGPDRPAEILQEFDERSRRRLPAAGAEASHEPLIGPELDPEIRVVPGHEDAALGFHPGAELELMAVQVLAPARVPGDDEGDLALVEALDDRPDAAVGDDERRTADQVAELRKERFEDPWTD